MRHLKSTRLVLRKKFEKDKEHNSGMIKDQEEIKRTAKLSGFLYQNIQKAKHILMGYKIQSLKNSISYQISYMADWFFSDSGCVSHHLLPMSFHRTFTCLIEFTTIVNFCVVFSTSASCTRLWTPRELIRLCTVVTWKVAECLVQSSTPSVFTNAWISMN